MSASSRMITRTLAAVLIVVALFTAWLMTRNGELPPGGAQPGQAQTGAASRGDPTVADAPPALPTKRHTRPSPAEQEQKRYERMKAEMVAQLDQLKVRYLGNHPKVRAAQQQLEELEANHAGKSLPAR